MRSKMRRAIQTVTAVCLVALLVSATGAFAQTGKITGTVTDAESGEPLPGVNVILEGTQQGATTNANGYYNILNVQPDVYDVQASFVGYAQETVTGVEVNIDLTSTVNFELQEQTVGLEEVTVQAQEEVVKADISSSRIDVSTEDIENMPVTDIQSVVGLQAGIQGMSVRGGDADGLNFRVDGLSLNSMRDSRPYTNISYTSVKQVQVQTGGFNAEYGNVRSGMVNVVSREGPRNRYTVDVLTRYSPAQKKHFGISPTDPNAYFMRPYLDDEVAWEGTDNGAWDSFTQNQYPDFVGFEEIAKNSLGDDDPSNDLTPRGAQELFKFRRRKLVEPTSPDYVIDGSIGGPVPVVGDYLGDLRFFASYRQEDEQYIVPLSREGYSAYNGRLKLTSNITPSIKLNLQHMVAEEKGTNGTRVGATTIRRDGNRQYMGAFSAGATPYRISDDALFATPEWTVGQIGRAMSGIDFTHTLSGNTFYEVALQRYRTEYDANPVAPMDTSCVMQFGAYCADGRPIGYSFEPKAGEITSMGIVHSSQFRDTSQVTQWQGSIDITSQIDQYNQVKAGVEFRAVKNDINYGHIDFLVNPDDIRAQWKETPVYGAAYAQDKVEYLGMIANIGLRLDYLDPNTTWWQYGNPYTEAFMGKNANDMPNMLEREPVDPKWKVSPRLGISFPVTDASKLYFNYGHFAQYPNPEYLYKLERMQTTNAVWEIANPNAPMPQTTAYELGYEQSLFDKFLIRVAGYYKDIRNQPRGTRFESRDGLVNYRTNFATNYEDIRGFEVSLYKNVGTWFRGFINYTYMVHSAGNFGLGAFYENPVRQANHEARAGANFQWKPLPQPYGRASLDFMTPVGFGPSLSGFHPIGDWRLNLLGRWKAGGYFTWLGEQSAPGVRDNMQWKDYYMVDMRLSKNLNLVSTDAMAYIDVQNVFNLRNFNRGAFYGPRDFQNYMKSLKLPKEMVEEIEDWPYETGNDKPGTIEKDYIDPPNLKAFRYLFPRRVMFGMRFSL